MKFFATTTGTDPGGQADVVPVETAGAAVPDDKAAIAATAIDAVRTFAGFNVSLS
jgi:hypothetical protein